MVDRISARDILKLEPEQVEKLAEALQLDAEEVEHYIMERFESALQAMQATQRARHGMRLLTPDQAAETLQVEPSTVKRWLRQGRLAGIKPGKEWRIRESDLQEFLLKQKKD